MAAAKAAPVFVNEEDKLRAILNALLAEPIFKEVSQGPLALRLATSSGIPWEEVCRITGLKEPQKVILGCYDKKGS